MGRFGAAGPATADLIARMAAGMGNDLLTTLILATSAPVAIAPAMNQQMYRNIATQENLQTLIRRGYLTWVLRLANKPVEMSAQVVCWSRWN